MPTSTWIQEIEFLVDRRKEVLTPLGEALARRPQDSRERSEQACAWVLEWGSVSKRAEYSPLVGKACPHTDAKDVSQFGIPALSLLACWSGNLELGLFTANEPLCSHSRQYI